MFFMKLEPENFNEQPLHPNHIQELNYHISSLTTELRNLRDVMRGLADTIFNNTEFTERNTDLLGRIVASNNAILEELQADAEETEDEEEWMIVAKNFRTVKVPERIT